MFCNYYNVSIWFCLRLLLNNIQNNIEGSNNFPFQSVSSEKINNVLFTMDASFQINLSDSYVHSSYQLIIRSVNNYLAVEARRCCACSASCHLR